MMKSEFENLAGREVTDEQYRAIETLYMSSNLEKTEFVKSMKPILKNIPQPEKKKDIKRMVVRDRSGYRKTPNGCYYHATRKENLRLRPYKRQQQRSEKMRFYHAAPKETMMKIYAEGVLKKSWDGVVYMCKDPIDACKFLVIRGMRQMSVIELELDEKEVEESHDHSETFFKCKAYIKHGDIVLSGDERIFDYDFE